MSEGMHFVGRLGWMLRFSRGEAWLKVEWVNRDQGWRVLLVRAWPLVLVWDFA